MLEILKKLKEDFGVFAIKSEFEAEGTRTDELVRLNELIFRAGLKSYVKIGGCEAVRDIDQCKLLGAEGVMAPMIESPFAMKKFVQAFKKVFGDGAGITTIINIETKTAFENLDGILEEAEGFLDDVVVGRVDLSASLGLTRSDINNDEMLGYVKTICEKAVAHGLKAAVGGGISAEAIDFVEKLGNSVSRCETRKIVFPVEIVRGNYRNAFHLAQEFEVLYLKNKCEFYSAMANEDAERVKMLEKRLNG